MSNNAVAVQYEHEVLDETLIIGGKTHKQEKQKWFISCSFKKIGQLQALLCVDSELHLLVYDLDKLYRGLENTQPTLQLSLIDDSNLLNYREAPLSNQEKA